MQEKSPQEAREWLVRELPKVEYLYQALAPDDPPGHRDFIVRSLKVMYLGLNGELKNQVVALRYPLRQWEWKDQAPLNALEKEMPGVMGTEWWQMQLSEMILPSNDPLLRILTSATDQPADSPKNLDRPT